MGRILSKQRTDLLKNAFFEFSFVEIDEENYDGEYEDEDVDPDREIFDSITDPAELHYIADIYNWDDGTILLNWIVDSPICDEATAKMIFWRAQPQDYTAMKIDENHWAFEDYQLLRKIILNFENGKYQAGKIEYDPDKDEVASDPSFRDPKANWDITIWLQEPVKGEKVIYEE